MLTQVVIDRCFHRVCTSSLSRFADAKVGAVDHVGVAMGAANRVLEATEAQANVGGAVDEVDGHRAGGTSEVQGVGGGG